MSAATVERGATPRATPRQRSRAGGAVPTRAARRAAGLACLEVWLRAAELAKLDALRGATPRATAIRNLIVCGGAEEIVDE